MNQSESIAELAAALAKAQGAMNGATKDSDNPFFKSKYADLASVWDACRKPLSDNGLSVVQTTEFIPENPELICIETTLLHASGQWVKGRLVGKPVKNDPQGVGSCITYFRRYSLQSMVGIAPEDDDGNAASGKAPDTKLISEKEKSTIVNMLNAKEFDKERTDKFLQYIGVESVESIKASDFQKAMSALRSAKGKA
jgi:hypothetical protein